MEIWKNLSTIRGFEVYSHYEISSYGRFRSIDRVYPSGRKIKGVLKKIRYNEKGYCIADISYMNKGGIVRIHKLVALAFIPNDDNKPEVNHKDGNKENNHVDNLEWATRQENIDHSVKNNLAVKGEDIHNSKLKVDDVVNIRNLYSQQKDSFNYKEVANYYNVGLATIYDVIARRTWNHVT